MAETYHGFDLLIQVFLDRIICSLLRLRGQKRTADMIAAWLPQEQRATLVWCNRDTIFKLLRTEDIRLLEVRIRIEHT